MMRPKIAAMRGYSLAEALIVMAIIGLISLVSIPNFISMYRSMKIKTAVRQLANDLRGARQEAVSRYRPVMVSFGTTAADRYSYWIYLWNPSTTPPQWEQRKAGQLEPETSLANRRVFFGVIGFPDLSGPSVPPAAPAADGKPDIIFEPNGSVRQPPVDPTVRVSTDMSVAKNEFILTIAPSGSVKVQ
jgi:type II secretory pathway pseudopilin PulG